MSTKISSHRADGIGWVTLDGPAQLNAIGTATYNGLTDAIRAHERAADVHVVIIHGAGDAFSAGADIAEIQSFQTGEEFDTFLQGLANTLDLIASSPLPIIAAIHGPAMGGGLELALACDLRIVAEDSRLGLPEAKLGVLPGAGGTQRLPRSIPVGIATEMLMTGAPITGKRAYEVGLANKLTTTDSLLNSAREMADAILPIPSQVFSAAKTLIRLSESTPLTDGIEREREVVTTLFDSPAGREGFAKFGKKESRGERAPQKEEHHA